MGTSAEVVNDQLAAATGLPAQSVTPLLTVTVCRACAASAIGLRTTRSAAASYATELHPIDPCGPTSVKLPAFTVLSFKSSLNVMTIVLFSGTLIASVAGKCEMIVGGVVSATPVVKLHI